MCKNCIALIASQQLQQTYHNLANNKKDISDNNQEDGSYLSSKLNYTTTVRDIEESSTDLLTEKLYRGLLANEFLLSLKEE